MSRRNASPAAVLEQLNEVINAVWLDNLYYRWQDEKEYEDFNDYKKAFEKHSKFKLLRARKSPMSFTFIIPEFPQAIYEIKCGARSNSWRRVS